jgi:GWxTD domain-containing protein
LPFVASLHYVASATPDSTLAVFGLSLANHALSFHRSADGLEGRYRVQVVFHQGLRIVAQFSSDETVLVEDRREARRTDESVVFQHLLCLPPGRLVASVVVRDQNRLASGRDERGIDVPAFGDGPELSGLVPVYRAMPRSSRADLPAILVNPRATSAQGVDTLRFYVEGYGVSPGALVSLRALRADGIAVWRDTVRLVGAAASQAGERGTTGAASRGLGSAVVVVRPWQLQLGQLRFEAALAERSDTARTVALVTFSDQWAVTDLGDLLSLQRHFGHDSEIAMIRDAPAADRGELWRAFWQRTDPDTTTPDNEALAKYLHRIAIANLRYPEESEPGWLTDRGEVYVTLGEPDRVDQADDVRTNRRVIRWTYVYGTETAVLAFTNDQSPQRFKLTLASRAEYERMLRRVRQEGRASG